MNERDKKIRVGLTVFFCSITLITLIKGTYAYPLTMENNNNNNNNNDNNNGIIVPLGGDGGSYKCWYCAATNEKVSGVVDYPPAWDCSSVWTSCPSSTPTPTPTKTPTPTPIKTPSPTPIKTPIEIPIETPIKTPTPVETPVKENACYVCSTDNNNFYWGLDKPEDGTNSCDSSWSITKKSYDECQPHEEIPSNPNTGDIMLYIAYMVAISALVYSGLNFYKYKKILKK